MLIINDVRLKILIDYSIVIHDSRLRIQAFKINLKASKILDTISFFDL